jgi:toxin HigB-1
MNLTFSNKKFLKCANNDSQATKELGFKRAKLFKRRLDDLSAAQTLEDVRYLPGNYHELRGDRKSQWSCDLDQPYRLIFTPQERPIPTNQDGQYIWIDITSVEIVEIVDYH